MDVGSIKLHVNSYIAFLSINITRFTTRFMWFDIPSLRKNGNNKTRGISEITSTKQLFRSLYDYRIIRNI
jgi:hypothetical protein